MIKAIVDTNGGYIKYWAQFISPFGIINYRRDEFIRCEVTKISSTPPVALTAGATGTYGVAVDSLYEYHHRHWGDFWISF